MDNRSFGTAHLLREKGGGIPNVILLEMFAKLETSMDIKVTTKRRGRKPSNPPAAGGRVQSVTRGLAVLEKLAEAEGGVSMTDLSQRLGLPPSTTHRLLSTLEKMGYVYQHGEVGLWYVGVRAFSIGCAFLHNRDLVAQAHPFLRALMEKSGETTNLAVFEDGEVVIIDQVQCREMMRMIANLGSHAPIHASALGKAFLASLPEADIAGILQRKGLPRLSPNTIDTPAKLRAELEITRRRGYAIDDEEHAVGLRCIASAIYNEHSEPLAAISISGPKPRISDVRMHEMGVIVRRAAAAVTAAMGGHVPAVPEREAV